MPVKPISPSQFMDVNQSNSFFSRSCPGESLLDVDDEPISKMKAENMKTNSLKQELPPQSFKVKIRNQEKRN